MIIKNLGEGSKKLSIEGVYGGGGTRESTKEVTTIVDISDLSKEQLELMNSPLSRDRIVDALSRLGA